MQNLKQNSQTITFAGVNAHFQNGIAKKQIRDLQDSPRSMILTAKNNWPTAISPALWPYALRMANEVYNYTIHDKSRFMKFEVFNNAKAESPASIWMSSICSQTGAATRQQGTQVGGTI